MRAGWLLAPLGLLLATPAAAKAPLAWPTGIYSNVQSSEVTGDIVGLEVRFYEEAGRHLAELDYCEGWCNETHVVEVTRGDNGFIMAYEQIFTGSEGDLPVEIRFVAWPVKGGMNFSTYQGRQNTDPDGKPQRLRRTTKLFGIAVARSGKE